MRTISNNGFFKNYLIIVSHVHSTVEHDVLATHGH